MPPHHSSSQWRHHLVWFLVPDGHYPSKSWRTTGGVLNWIFWLSYTLVWLQRPKWQETRKWFKRSWKWKCRPAATCHCTVPLRVRLGGKTPRLNRIISEEEMLLPRIPSTTHQSSFSSPWNPERRNFDHSELNSEAVWSPLKNRAMLPCVARKKAG